MIPAGENYFLLMEQNHVAVSCSKVLHSFEFLAHFPAAAVPVGATHSPVVVYRNPLKCCWLSWPPWFVLIFFTSLYPRRFFHSSFRCSHITCSRTLCCSSIYSAFFLCRHSVGSIHCWSSLRRWIKEHEGKPLFHPQDFIRPLFVSWIWSSKLCWFDFWLTRVLKWATPTKLIVGSMSQQKNRTKKPINPAMTCHNSEASQITQVTPGADLLGTPTGRLLSLGFAAGGRHGRERRVFWLVHLSVHLSLPRYRNICATAPRGRGRGGVVLIFSFFLIRFEFCWGSGEDGEKSRARQNVLFPCLEFFCAHPTGS